MSRTQASIEAVVASAIWGIGFIGARWALVDFSPMWVNSLRFGISIAAAGPLLFLIPTFRRSMNATEFFASWKPGFWLGVCLALQTYGLKYTTVAKSGFITCLYVIFVPVVGMAFYRMRIAPSHWLWVGLSLLGAALMCEVDSLNVNQGDWLTLGCAVACAFQIIEVARAAPLIQSSFVFTVGQAFWALVPGIVILILEPAPTLQPSAGAVAGLLILSLGSTLVAFAMQMRAQKVLDPAVASLLFLMESPFAALFGYWAFTEVLAPWQAFGGVLILAAAAGTMLRDRPAAA